MIPQLPNPVALYLSISNGATDTPLSACFAPDATVTDEHHTHRGIPAIQTWLDDARQKYQHSVEPLHLSTEGDRVVLVGRVAGTFPGSPIELTYRFGIAGDRIQSLEIH
jgi:hypothetical protein